jgi:anaerobic magnesium-protoporphyrin IX monomethyl ester cyclase
MKVLLVSTPFEKSPLFVEQRDDDSDYPVGLAYLHTALEEHGHIVRTNWLNNYPEWKYPGDWQQLLSNNIMFFKPDIIGFNVLTSNRISTYQGIEIIHKLSPKTQIVLGGIHATIMYKQLLEKYPDIIIVCGEGEITFNNLITNLSNLPAVNGIAYSLGGKTVKNPEQALIENLDDISFPKHELFFKGNRAFADILTARGCPNSCSFCCLKSMSQRKVRFRSVENVIEEIEYLIKSFPKLNTIWIQDDSFFIDSNRVIRFCDEIIKRNIKIIFRCAGRVKPVTKEMVQKLEQAGFVEIRMGLESGDAQILKDCHKGITLEDVTKAIEIFADSNINLLLYVIVGLPGETEQTILTTAKFIQKLQRIKYIHFFDVCILLVYPGTEIYELAKQYGTINDDFWLESDVSFPYYTVDNPPEITQRYKDLLLDYVKMERIFTLNGFIHQFFMIPWILFYNLKYDRRTKKVRKWY